MTTAALIVRVPEPPGTRGSRVEVVAPHRETERAGAPRLAAAVSARAAGVIPGLAVAKEIDASELVRASGPDRLPAFDDARAVERHVVEPARVFLRTTLTEPSENGAIREEDVLAEKLIVRDDVHEVRIAIAAVAASAGHVAVHEDGMLRVLARHHERFAGPEHGRFPRLELGRRAGRRLRIVPELRPVDGGDDPPRALLAFVALPRAVPDPDVFGAPGGLRWDLRWSESHAPCVSGRNMHAAPPKMATGFVEISGVPRSRPG